MVRISERLFIPDEQIEMTAIRAQGAGGQNVNKVATAVHLRFDIGASCLPQACKERLLASGDHRITRQGVVVIKAQEYRTLEKNREAALARLVQLIRRALVPVRRRTATRPTPGAVARRLEGKTRRGRLKRNRRRVTE